MDMSTKSVMTSVGETLKSARTVVALQAERTTLATITLPKAYAALGRAIFAGNQFRSDFPALYEEIDRLVAEQAKVSPGPPDSPSRSSNSLGDKAQRLVAGAKDLAVSKTLALQVARAQVKLGEAAYAKHGASVGQPAVTQAIGDHLSKLAKLDSELASASQSLASGSTGAFPRKNLLLIAGGFGLLLFLGMIFMRGGGSSSGASAVTKSTEASSLPSGSKQVKVAIKHPPKVSNSFQFEVPEQNGYLSGMRCIRNEDGELIFTFTISGWHKTTGLMGWPMIIRMFDRNGNYLKHFTTERFALEGMVPEQMRQFKKIKELKRGENTLVYSVNMRDLRETEYVEISFLDTADWAETW